MNKWVFRILVIIIVALVGVGGVLAYKNITTPKKVHYHAGFVVFVNDKKVDFSTAQYVYAKPCMADEKESEPTSPAENQIEKAHLHEYVGDVAHIERTNSYWKDLFTNLHYPIDYTKATAYINGKKVAGFQNKPIHPYDSLVVLIGNNNVAKDLNQAVTKSHMQQEENKSEDCGK